MDTKLVEVGLQIVQLVLLTGSAICNLVALKHWYSEPVRSVLALCHAGEPCANQSRANDGFAAETGAAGRFHMRVAN